MDLTDQAPVQLNDLGIVKRNHLGIDIDTGAEIIQRDPNRLRKMSQIAFFRIPAVEDDLWILQKLHNQTPGHLFPEFSGIFIRIGLRHGDAGKGVQKQFPLKSAVQKCSGSLKKSQGLNILETIFHFIFINDLVRRKRHRTHQSLITEDFSGGYFDDRLKCIVDVFKIRKDLIHGSAFFCDRFHIHAILPLRIDDVSIITCFFFG